MNQIRLRHAILCILMMLFIIPASAQSTAGSSIASRTLLVSDGTKKTEKRVYANGTPVSNPTTFGFALHYYNKDHLGSNREVVSYSGTVQQVTNYYPFGAPYADPNAVVGSTLQPFKYNGKELDRMHGLDNYDYGARQYNPIVARWDRMDPLCEKYYNISPYAYCGNNPVNAIDINGDSIFYDMPIIEDGRIVGQSRYTYGQYGNTWGFGRNGELYQGSNYTISSISNALNKISSGGSYGKSLISQLSGNTGTNVSIEHGFNSSSFDKVSNLVKIKWDSDDFNGTGPDINGNTYVDPFITLGHELLHAQNYIEGNINRNTWFSVNGKNIPYEEHIVSVRENYLRFENGIPLKKYYASYGESQRGYEPSLINNPRCLINYKRP